jgi:hypothetical protein
VKNPLNVFGAFHFTIFTDSLRQLYKYFEAAQTHRKTTLIITAYYCNIATRPLQHTSAMYATRVNRQSETVNGRATSRHLDEFFSFCMRCGIGVSRGLE